MSDSDSNSELEYDDDFNEISEKDNLEQNTASGKRILKLKNLAQKKTREIKCWINFTKFIRIFTFR